MPCHPLLELSSVVPRAALQHESVSSTYIHHLLSNLYARIKPLQTIHLDKCYRVVSLTFIITHSQYASLSVASPVCALHNKHSEGIQVCTIGTVVGIYYQAVLVNIIKDNITQRVQQQNMCLLVGSAL